MDYNQNYSQAQSQGPNQNGSHRPWEPMAPASQQQTLPSISTLTSKLPPPVDRAHPDLSINPPQRDSGAWMSNNNSACELERDAAEVVLILSSDGFLE